MTAAPDDVWVIVVAAGSGRRFGGDTPKQFTVVAGKRVLDHSVAAARASGASVVVVLPADALDAAPDDCRAIAGGSSRSESVRAGLSQVPSDAPIVLVHDAARPCATPQLFAAVANAVRDGADAVTPVVSVIDTLRHVDGSLVDRADLTAVQTPQGFTTAALRAAHETAPDATDDASLIAAAGGRVVTVPGERWNIKLTDPEDEFVIGALLGDRQ